MMKTALTGVMSASRDLSVISNNLANAMTVGFKRSTAQYVDVMKMMYLRAAEGRADAMSSPRIPKAAV